MPILDLQFAIAWQARENGLTGVRLPDQPSGRTVAIVGAGFTGLWAAYSLLEADPSMRVLVIDKEVAGFGASGRNGGWCVGELSGGLAASLKRFGDYEGRRMTRAIMDTVDLSAMFHALADRARAEADGSACVADRPRFVVTLKDVVRGAYAGAAA